MSHRVKVEIRDVVSPTFHPFPIGGPVYRGGKPGQLLIDGEYKGVAHDVVCVGPGLFDRRKKIRLEVNGDSFGPAVGRIETSYTCLPLEEDDSVTITGEFWRKNLPEWAQ